MAARRAADLDELLGGVARITVNQRRQEPEPDNLDELLRRGVAGIERPLHEEQRAHPFQPKSESQANKDAFRVMMHRNRSFFQSPLLSQPSMTVINLNILLQEISRKEAGNHRMRRDILVKILETKLLTMEGPVAGTIRKLINGEENPPSAELNTCLISIMDLLDEVVTRIPGFRQTFQTVAILVGLMDLVPQQLKSEQFKKRLDDLKYRIQDPETLEKQMEQTDKKWSPDSTYLQETILPRLQDLLQNKLDDKYINVIKGPYQSTNHYIETWFRLMQEDFLSPLRKAISEYKTLFTPEETVNQGLTLDDGYHYCFTKILDTERIQGETAYLMKLCLDGLWHVDWEETDRLKPGSLLALSNDHYESSVYALVCHNEEKPARAGTVWVSTLDDSRPATDRPLHGIEPMAFFEPYRCVLTRLRQHGVRCELGAHFPYEKYLIRCENDVKPPVYLPIGTEIVLQKKVREGSKEDFLFFLDIFLPRTEDKKFGRTGSITDYGFNMDESQVEAINHALTHELAIIQGPPGCGKSFIGAQLVNILMLNADLWRTYDNGCILMIAFTNHAIDQFIQDCEKSGTDMTRAVRVGSRADQNTVKYQLRNKRHALKDHFISREQMRNNRALQERLIQINKRTRALEAQIRQPRREMNPPIKFLGFSLEMAFQRRYKSTLNSAVFASWMEGLDELDEDSFIPELSNIEPMSDEEMARFQYGPELFQIETEDRKRLYAAWCEKAKEELKEELEELKPEKNRLSDEVHRSQRELDIATVRLCNIIAMTTTGASKHAHLLEAVRPTIVLVEEAAEVLESHIVSPLTLGCQHLIMIGDHQQLRPGISEHEMEEKNLSISLFERLVLNEFPNCQLKTQRRMHPDISSLLVPHIYPALVNHDSVSSYPEIDGVLRRMFFLDHEHFERQTDEKSSRHNEFEARYLSILCRYLLLQGYSEKDISIICTYAGQVKLVKQYIEDLSKTHPDPLYTYNEKKKMLLEEFQDLAEFVSREHTYMSEKMKKWYEKRNEEYQKRLIELHRPRSRIGDVPVKTVDNYQGEENKIILLSFVRSNNDGKIGFLKWANRICVALSRAKHGFFAVGNFKLFAKNTKSDLWKKLCLQLKSQNDIYLGENLKIICQIHRKIREVSDGQALLDAAPDGGCKEVCGVELECGHNCSRFCHLYDTHHDLYACKIACDGELDCGHPCTKLCHQVSDSKLFFAQTQNCPYRKCKECGKEVNCKVEREVTHPCGHVDQVPCSMEVEECNRKEQITLPCGHRKRVSCTQRGQMTAIKCTNCT